MKNFMNYKPLFLLLILVTVSLFNGCKQSENKTFEKHAFQEVILKAMRGDAKANDTLSQLFDLTIPVNPRYNTLIIDSINTQHGRTLYTILLEYPNPFYNRFAVYDSSLRLMLIDRSLNGNLKKSTLKVGTMQFIQITESFRSKDNIALERTSIYGMKRDSVVLGLRTFTKYNDSTVVLDRSIESMSKNLLLMKVNAKPKAVYNIDIDRFTLDTNSMKYKPDNTLFDSKVSELILLYKKPYSDDQIFDKKSALASVGNLAAPDTVKGNGNSKSKKMGFTISLPASGWTIEKDIFISNQLKKPTKGVIFTNNSEGAKIQVIELGLEDQAENHVNYSLDKSASKNYLIRFTDKITFKRNYIRFFEFTASNKRFLLIFDAPQTTYSKNSDMYEQMINSFKID